MDDPNASPAQDLGRALGALRRRWLAALAIVVVTLGATFAISRLSATKYEATAQILLQQPEQVNAVLNPDASTSAANVQREINTNAQLITSIPVMNQVRSYLHLSESARELIDRLSVTGEATSNLVEITAQDARADRAAEVATAVANQYLAYRQDFARGAIGSAINAARDRLGKMDAATPEGQALESRLHQLETGSAVTTGGVQVVRPATIPTVPAARLKPLTLAVAVLLALGLAALAVALLERLDRRLLDESAVEAAFGLEVISRIPASRGGGHRDRQRIEAFDALAARLRLAGAGGRSRVLMVAPAGPYREDDVAIRLAEAMSELQPRVLLIDADLRHEGGAAAAVRVSGGGLTALLRGESTLDEELVVATYGDEADDPFAGRAWTLLPAGPGSSRPTGLLASHEMTRLLELARRRADVVIVAAPPLTSAADALALAPQCDVILVDVRKRTATLDDAQAAREVLDIVETPVAGIVLQHGAPAPWSPEAVEDVRPQHEAPPTATPASAGALGGPRPEGAV